MTGFPSSRRPSSLSRGHGSYILRGGPGVTEVECICGWTYNSRKGTSAAEARWRAHSAKEASHA